MSPYFTKAQRIGKGLLIKHVLPTRKRISTNYFQTCIATSPAVDKLRKAKKLANDYLTNSILFSHTYQRLKLLLFKNELKEGPYDYALFKEMLFNLFSNYHIDLVVLHPHDIYDVDRLLMHEALVRNIPYTIQVHFNNNLFNLLMMRKYALSAKGVAGVSNLCVPRHIRDKYVNLADGIDTNFFKREHTQYKQFIQSGFHYILLPARIAPGKGHIDLIKAVYSLRNKNINVKIAFAGRFDQQEILSKIYHLSKSTDCIDSIVQLGHLTTEELRNWYAISDLVVLPSESEGLPRVLLEAQAMSIPVIAYSVGGIPEVVKDNETGYLVKKGNIRALAEKIEILLKDASRRRQMGEAARKHIENNFSIESLVRRHEDFYIKMMAR